MAQIYCFGDSITYGAWDEQQSGWVQRLRLALDKRMRREGDYSLLYGLGTPGETTEGLRQRFVRETESRFNNKEKEEAVFLFAFGANDAAFIPSKNKFRVDAESFARNLRDTLNEARKWSDKILFLNVTPVVELVAVNPPGKDKSRKNEWVERYNAALSQVAGEHQISVVDVYSAFIQEGHESLFVADGLHPNAKGHELIFDLVYPALMDILNKSILGSIHA